MFFLLSKLFWFVVAPSHVIIWLIIAAAILLYLNRIRTAKWVASAAAVIAVLIGLLPFGAWLMAGLENNYPLRKTPTHVDGIIVLGGGSRTDIFLARQSIATDHGLPRLVETAMLARRYPNARVVFTGGSGDPRQQNFPEAITARHILLGLGVPPAQLVVEGKSRNTWENFVFTKQIIKPRPGETWLLVTSAFHMPRALGIAERVGWQVQPWPVDYFTTDHIRFTPEAVIDNIERTDIAFHEYLGLLTYRLSGKSA